MLVEMGMNARAAARELSQATTKKKDDTLLYIADQLTRGSDEILGANQEDIHAASQDGLDAALIDRLTLTRQRLQGISNDLRGVASLNDPVGEIFDAVTLPNGLRVHKQRVPLGVLAVIYESRPNVTLDVAALALKTGNAAILRGGSETLQSNRALVGILQQALVANGLPSTAIQFIDNPDRSLVNELLEMYEYIDMLIPRGGAELHRFCRENSRIPVITGGIGICHLFVDDSADLKAALPLIYNAKVQRPTVCNALDTLLVHQAIAADFLPRVVEHLRTAGVTFRAGVNTQPFLAGEKYRDVLPAGAQDFDTEWLSLVLGLKVVAGLDEAIEHITVHSTGHSDGILTGNQEHARHFVAEIDSAAVYVNASTRFTDGGQLGLGAEVAISTQRLHARGPMGLRELTTYKWVIEGDYHVRA
jgi:glutamate-5-semialdehyde dehydrogenase